MALLIAFAFGLRSFSPFANVAVVQALVFPQVGAQFANAACSSLWLVEFNICHVVLYILAFPFGMPVFFGWLWPRGMRYVERITVVACGPMLVFVVGCGRVKCIVLFVVAAGLYVN